MTNLVDCAQVYVVAQRMSQRCSIEQFAIALAQHFVRQYPLVRLIVLKRLCWALEGVVLGGLVASGFWDEGLFGHNPGPAHQRQRPIICRGVNVVPVVVICVGRSWPQCTYPSSFRGSHGAPGLWTLWITGNGRVPR